jgi:hypothetical protein
MVFNDIEFSEGEWTDYDEKVECMLAASPCRSPEDHHSLSYPSASATFRVNGLGPSNQRGSNRENQALPLVVADFRPCKTSCFQLAVAKLLLSAIS